MSGVDIAPELDSWPPTPLRQLPEPETEKVDPKPKVLYTQCHPFWFAMFVSLFKDGPFSLENKTLSRDAEFETEREYTIREAVQGFVEGKADAVRLDTAYSKQDVQGMLDQLVQNKPRVSITEYEKPSQIIKWCNWLAPIVAVTCLIETLLAGAWAGVQLVEGNPVNVTIPLYIRLLALTVGGLENTPGVEYLLEGIGLCLVIAGLAAFTAYNVVKQFPQLQFIYTIMLPNSFLIVATDRCSEHEARQVFEKHAFIDPFRFHGGIV